MPRSIRRRSVTFPRMRQEGHDVEEYLNRAQPLWRGATLVLIPEVVPDKQLLGLRKRHRAKEGQFP